MNENEMLAAALAMCLRGSPQTVVPMGSPTIQAAPANTAEKKEQGDSSEDWLEVELDNRLKQRADIQSQPTPESLPSDQIYPATKSDTLIEVEDEK